MLFCVIELLVQSVNECHYFNPDYFKNWQLSILIEPI